MRWEVGKREGKERGEWKLSGEGEGRMKVGEGREKEEEGHKCVRKSEAFNLQQVTMSWGSIYTSVKKSHFQGTTVHCISCTFQVW